MSSTRSSDRAAPSTASAVKRVRHRLEPSWLIYQPPDQHNDVDRSTRPRMPPPPPPCRSGRRRESTLLRLFSLLVSSVVAPPTLINKRSPTFIAHAAHFRRPPPPAAVLRAAVLLLPFERAGHPPKRRAEGSSGRAMNRRDAMLLRDTRPTDAKEQTQRRPLPSWLSVAMRCPCHSCGATRRPPARCGKNKNKNSRRSLLLVGCV